MRQPHAAACDSERAMLSPPLFVVQTWYIERDGLGLYRIELAPGPRLPRLVLTTADQGVYHTALDAEGRDVRLVARWHVADGRQVCDALLPAPVPLHPDERIPR